MNESEKSADLRPRLPWLSRVGTKNGELNSLGHLIRGAAALLALFNPVASAVMGLCMLLLSRTRVKGWWLWLGGGVATAVALITGWVAKYNTVWRELLVAVRQAVELRDPSVVGDVFADWPSLLLWQVPVGIALGVMLAGFRLSYRARYYAAWRPTVVVASERAVAKAARLIDTGTRRAVERPDDVVIRLGVDADTAKVFELPAVALRMHAVVAGPTGFGKSTTVQRMIEGLVAEPSARAAQIGALLIDMKGDPEMVAFLRGVAHAAGRPFYLVTERQIGRAHV